MGYVACRYIGALAVCLAIWIVDFLVMVMVVRI